MSLIPTHSPTHPSSHSLTHSTTHPSTHSTHPLTHPPAHPLTPLTHSLRSPTHSPTLTGREREILALQIETFRRTRRRWQWWWRWRRRPHSCVLDGPGFPPRPRHTHSPGHTWSVAPLGHLLFLLVLVVASPARHCHYSRHHWCGVPAATTAPLPDRCPGTHSGLFGQQKRVV